MKIFTSLKEGQLTLFFSGELDHHGAKESMKKIEGIIDEYLPRDCIIDLAGLSFMDSSGIAVILRTYKRLHEMGGRVWVEHVPAQAMRVIDASGIDRIVKITSDAKENIR